MRNVPLPSLLELGHSVLSETLARLHAGQRSCVAVDATCGNGHDTLFIMQTLRELHAQHTPGSAWNVVAFDVQQDALDATAITLAKNGFASGFELIHCGHETLEDVLASRYAEHALGIVVYNLGYLPGSDKTVITAAETTLVSLHAAARLLVPGGLLLIHAYGGHAGGSREMDQVETWCAALPSAQWAVARYAFCNKAHNAETLFLAARKAPDM